MLGKQNSGSSSPIMGGNPQAAQFHQIMQQIAGAQNPQIAQIMGQMMGPMPQQPDSSFSGGMPGVTPQQPMQFVDQAPQQPMQQAPGQWLRPGDSYNTAPAGGGAPKGQQAQQRPGAGFGGPMPQPRPGGLQNTAPGGAGGQKPAGQTRGPGSVRGNGMTQPSTKGGGSPGSTWQPMRGTGFTRASGPQQFAAGAGGPMTSALGPQPAGLGFGGGGEGGFGSQMQPMQPMQRPGPQWQR